MSEQSELTKLPRADEMPPVVVLEPDPLGRRIDRRLRPLTPNRLLETVRRRIESRQDRAELMAVRGRSDVAWRPGLDQPLVTVRIATYRAAGTLRRSIDSALSQTYPRVEVLVIGDACDDATAEVARGYGESVRFLNLPHRGQYPADAHQRWMVAGTTPMNTDLDLAGGDWIAPCDDDDVLTPTHVERLLDRALTGRFEMVWSRAGMQHTDGSWRLTQGPPMRHGQISHGSVLYCADIRFIRHNRRSYLSGTPGDWDTWRRMHAAGVRIGFLDELTYYHFA
ncbi:MAG: hypothetical protein NVSMB13_19900 [Mycobacteriales bacterium]